MAVTGKIHRSTPEELATFEVTEQFGFDVIDVTYQGQLVIRLPLSIGADNNEIALRLRNAVQQTALENMNLTITFD